MYSIGIMQGRLTEPKGRGIQFFPFENWENEFYIAAELGLNEIEFIFDYDRYEENPLYTSDGIKSINEIIAKTGVMINSICFDYFMKKPFYKAASDRVNVLRKENEKLLEQVITSCKAIGARIVEIPLVDNSSIKTQDEEDLFVVFISDIAKNTDVIINLETDYEPSSFRRLLQYINLRNVMANYDSGNSSGLGYDLYHEVTTLNSYISNVHIKDRRYKGTSVPLGQGDADFVKLFNGLSEIEYSGSYILQAARSNDGNEKQNIKEQILFLKKLINSHQKRTI
ncbi:MAG: sugar phosphate isomerase/epimerase [Bacteroidales bacterium]|jgi:hexulose-6-phosphate isomerase|nr:sugar phosphate isomerase/epimerase [Bacteroidales bacterium]